MSRGFSQAMTMKRTTLKRSQMENKEGNERVVDGRPNRLAGACVEHFCIREKGGQRERRGEGGEKRGKWNNIDFIFRFTNPVPMTERGEGGRRRKGEGAKCGAIGIKKAVRAGRGKKEEKEARL